MHAKRKVLLAAGLIAGAAALTGCTARITPVATPTPQAPRQTAQPATAEPAASMPAEAADEPTEEPEQEVPLKLEVSGEETDAKAITENGELLLPLEATGEALGWKARSEETQEETRVKRVVTLEKDASRITVSWAVSDNTVESITWQKDGLLIPVDTRLTTVDGVVYVPAAFFEEAMDVRIAQEKTKVILSTPEPMDTPQTMEESSGENG